MEDFGTAKGNCKKVRGNYKKIRSFVVSIEIAKDSDIIPKRREGYFYDI